MFPRKSEKPSVATFADYEIITPPNTLRRTLSTVPDGEAADDPVAQAEAALANLSSKFAAWMDAESVRLDAARQAVKAGGFTKATRDALFHAAHDIKGHAATFGYPTVGEVAKSLCRLIEQTGDLLRIPLALVDQHVDAVGAIVRESAGPDSTPIAEALAVRLREVTEDFLARENGKQADHHLDDILGPALAPGDHGAL